MAQPHHITLAIGGEPNSEDGCCAPGKERVMSWEGWPTIDSPRYSVTLKNTVWLCPSLTLNGPYSAFNMHP